MGRLKMRQIVVNEYGDPSVLKLVESPTPEPQPNEVRIAVQAAGVAYADLGARSGLYGLPLPLTPGLDVVGVVDKVGAEVTHLREGQLVGALVESGGYADIVCTPAFRVVPIPFNFDPAEAVCLITNYLAAYQILHRVVQVQPGMRTLIHGAAGGVGTALIDLGKLANLTMFATASPDKLASVAKLGALTINYQYEDFVDHVRSAGLVDAVFDSVGGDYLERSYTCLKEGGILVLYGLSSVKPPDAEAKFQWNLDKVAELNRANNRRAVVFETQVQQQNAEYHADLQTLFNLFNNRQIHPLVAERIPLAEAARAHELLEARKLVGKIVLTTT
jgi:NADPH:quinone reductase-like Zn-dependent oxidoreductase